MKVLLLSCALLAAFSTSHAIWDYLKEFKPDAFLSAAISHLVNTKEVAITREPLPVEENVWLYVATRKFPNLTLFTPGESFADRNIDASKPLIIWCHGYIDNGLSSWMRDAADKTLIDRDVTFMAIDWHPNANLFYPFSAAITKHVGEYVGEVVSNLTKTEGLDPSKIICVGHSLGAHISGFIGKTIKKLTNTLIAAIFGLDPAGPCFWGFNIDGLAPCENRLCKTDGEKVIAVHSNIGVFGVISDIGTGDLWLASCRSALTGFTRSYIQSDCPLDILPGGVDCCSHLRSYEWFIPTIIQPVVCYKCKTILCAYSIAPKAQFNGYNTDIIGTHYASFAGKASNFTQCN